MADETNILDQLISRVPDESLRSHLSREVDLLRGSRHFGLVFDRHLPESVRLVDYPIRKGVRVSLRDESSTDTWTVVGFADQERKVAVLSDNGGTAIAGRSESRSCCSSRCSRCGTPGCVGSPERRLIDARLEELRERAAKNEGSREPPI